jgi:SAM-dependent methyltransferase
MPLSPRLYDWFVRPKWLTKKYIHDHIMADFPLMNKDVLDFGCGTGANCGMFDPDRYLGIEPCSKRVSYAKRLYPNHRFQVFDEKEIPVPDHSLDYVFSIAVLHHIPDELINHYLQEFERVLKPDGTVIVMEPCLCENKPFNNRFMNWYDDGEYIREEEHYLRLFHDRQFECTVIKKFTKCFVYNEIFFKAETGKAIMDNRQTSLH